MEEEELRELFCAKISIELKKFKQNILRWIESGEAQKAYYDSEDLY